MLKLLWWKFAAPLLDEPLAYPLQAQHTLLIDILDRYESHVGSLHRFADRSGIGRVILSAAAAHAIGGDKLGRHQFWRVAEASKGTRPVMRARAGFHADHARW